MNSFAFIAFFAALAIAHAGHVLQGPSSRTTLVGPEGSVISSVAPGGTVITDSHSGVVADTAPVAYAAAPLAYSAVATHGVPVATHGVPVAYTGLVNPWAYTGVPVAYSAPVVAHGSVDTVVSGPSGTIAASRSLNVADLVAHNVW